MDTILLTLTLMAMICAVIYLFLIWNFGYWKKLGLKEADALPFLGSFPSQFTQRRNPVYDVDELYSKYKKTENFIGVYNCRTPQLLVLNPKYVRKVFVDDFRYFHDNEFSNLINKKKDVILGNNPFVLKGEEWKERRAEITPGLTAGRVASVYPVTVEVCKSFANFISNEIKVFTKSGLNAKEICLRFTTEVVSDCVLGIKAKSFSSNPTPILEMIQKGFQHSNAFVLYSAISNLMPQIRKYYVHPFFPKDVASYFFNLMLKSVQLRRQTEQTDRADFLNYMLQLQDRKHLSIEDLTSHTMTFLIDGFETTASVLAHTLLSLARHPRVMNNLRAEIGTSILSITELNELPYLDACIHECMRLFSPQLVAHKLCTESYEFVNKNGTSLKIEPGMVVLIPTFSISRDPNIYENPEVFRPERFLAENGGVKKYRDMGAFLGFGNGPRACLGMRFALTQMKSAIVEIVRRFDITVNPKTRNDNYLDTYFMGTLKGGIWLNFKEM